MNKDASPERNVTEEDVREEHLREVNSTAHWIYLAVVLAGSLILNLALIALFGSMS